MKAAFNFGCQPFLFSGGGVCFFALTSFSHIPDGKAVFVLASWLWPLQESSYVNTMTFT